MLIGLWLTADAALDYKVKRGHIRLTPGILLRKAETELTLVRAVSQSGTRPEQVEDLRTDAVSVTVTKDNLDQLCGTNPEYVLGDSDQGPFFVKSTDCAPLQVKLVTKNTTTEQLFVVPAALTAGSCRLELRSKVKGRSQLKNGRVRRDAYHDLMRTIVACGV